MEQPNTVDEYRRTFAGRQGVLGATGVHRAAFASIAQTEQPVIAIVGVSGQGAKVGTVVKLVAENVKAVTSEDCGHFIPEESPEQIFR